MSERRVSKVMPEGDRFYQILVQAQSLRYGSCYLRNLQRMGKAISVMVALRRQKNLGLILQPAKRLAVKDPVPL